MNGQKAKSVFGRRAGLRRSRINRGQSMVEFAMISIVALLLMTVGIQYALLGETAVAVSQGASTLARYCAVNAPGVFGTDNGAATLPVGATELLSPTICPAGSCPNLTVKVASYSGTTTNTTTTPGFGDRCVVSLSFDATSKLALPNPFLKIPGVFPGVTFPTSFTGADSQLYEQGGR